MIFDELEDISTDLEAAHAPLLARTEDPYTRHNPGVPVGQRRPLDREIYEWRKTFVGQPTLHFFLAALVVILRRNYKPETYWPMFERIWTEQSDFMCATVNAKWLASSCDTIMDYGPSKSERAIAGIGAILIKTVKLYETERYLGNGYARPIEAENYIPKDMFDGMHTFNIGFGDVMVNFKTRLLALTQEPTPASIITREMFDRVSNKYDTAVSRFRAQHTMPETLW